MRTSFVGYESQDCCVRQENILCYYFSPLNKWLFPIQSSFENYCLVINSFVEIQLCNWLIGIYKSSSIVQGLYGKVLII